MEARSRARCPSPRNIHVAAINWGSGRRKKHKTYLPWDSWQTSIQLTREPAIWFHEIFRADGTPYRQEEADFIPRNHRPQVAEVREAALLLPLVENL